jgi:hypothetical protein
MAQPIPDLWPDIEQSQVVPPVAILREQAALLGKKTNHLLEGRVVSTNTGYGGFVHSFYIVAPTLDDYAYKLFEISHGVDPYPVLVPALLHRGALGQVVPVGGPQLASEQELLDYIRRILNSDETMRVVGSLLAQVKATS